MPEIAEDQPQQGLFRKRPLLVTAWRSAEAYTCNTKSGPIVAPPGSWIILEADGEGCYPCAPDTFLATYQYAGDAPSAEAEVRADPLLAAKAAAWDALAAEARGQGAYPHGAVRRALVRHARAAGLPDPFGD